MCFHPCLAVYVSLPTCHCAERSRIAVWLVSVALQGRAIATFRSRAQAHAAITRLHGRETLAGLRMRLFYLHEQQQRQHLLAQTPQSLITSVGQLSLDAPTPALAAALSTHANHGAAAPGNNPGDGVAAAAAAAVGGSRVVLGGSVAGAAGEEGADRKVGEEGGGSSRSSFDKDQGPVVSRNSGWLLCVCMLAVCALVVLWCVVYLYGCKGVCSAGGWLVLVAALPGRQFRQVGMCVGWFGAGAIGLVLHQPSGLPFSTTPVSPAPGHTHPGPW